MSTRNHLVTLTPKAIAVIVEALGVCLDSDTFLDDTTQYNEAEAVNDYMRSLP